MAFVGIAPAVPQAHLNDLLPGLQEVGEPLRTPSASPLTVRQERDLALFTAILRDESIELEIRRGVAENLLEMGIPEALRVLEGELTTGDDAGKQAVLAAIPRAEHPPAQFLDLCLSMLSIAPVTLHDDLAVVLSRYGAPARQAIAAIASDPSRPEMERLAAIRALGEFQGRDAAAELMRLMDEAGREPESVICAAGESLRRLTELRYACDAGAWRRWWADASRLPPEEWESDLVRVLSARRSELERQNADERAARERITARLSTVYNDLFPAMSEDEQLRRLPALLDDELPIVREFAVRRIERLMRDSVRIPVEIQDALAQRLGDPGSVRVRAQASRLLEQLSYENAPELIARQLGRERDASVAAALLDVLSRRPTLSAVEPATAWIANPTVGPAAANAIWALEDLSLIEVAHREAAIAALRDAAATKRLPERERLRACLEPSDDPTEIEALLDGDDPALRRAVAEGFARRLHRRPLVDRAGDPIIYPHALYALAHGPSDPASFQMLASLTPDEAAVDLWTDAVLTLAGRMNPADVLDADFMLGQFSQTTPELRRAMLLRVAQREDVEIPPEQQRDLLSRLAPLLMDAQQAELAHELLSALDEQDDTQTLKVLRFKAAALTDRYELAAGYEDVPESWVSLLEWAAELDSETAVQLHDEILRRYGDRITGQLQADFEAISAKISASNAVVEEVSMPDGTPTDTAAALVPDSSQDSRK